MGLFSFIKNAGSSLFNKKVSPEKANEAKETKLKEVIGKLGIHVSYLNIKVDDDKVTISGVTKNRADKEKLVLAVGNVDGIASVDDQLEVEKPVFDETKILEEETELIAEEAESAFYTVQKGDSLSKIAKEHYGNGMKYPVIFEANKPMLSHPDKIYPGQVLRIPPLEA